MDTTPIGREMPQAVAALRAEMRVELLALRRCLQSLEERLTEIEIRPDYYREWENTADRADD